MILCQRLFPDTPTDLLCANWFSQDAAEPTAGGDATFFPDLLPVSPRDMRLVLPLGQTSSPSSITLRRGAIFAAFPPMRGVLTASSCIIVLEGADSEVENLRVRACWQCPPAVVTGKLRFRPV